MTWLRGVTWLRGGTIWPAQARVTVLLVRLFHGRPFGFFGPSPEVLEGSACRTYAFRHFRSHNASETRCHRRAVYRCSPRASIFVHSSLFTRHPILHCSWTRFEYLKPRNCRGSLFLQCLRFFFCVMSMCTDPLRFCSIVTHYHAQPQGICWLCMRPILGINDLYLINLFSDRPFGKF